jgi:hypothetical protein
MLVVGASDLQLKLLLPPSTITHPSENPSDGTTIDLVWGNHDEAEEILLKCDTTTTSNDHRSDHLPIEILLETHLRKTYPLPRPWNFTKTDWKSFQSCRYPGTRIFQGTGRRTSWRKGQQSREVHAGTLSNTFPSY